MGISNGIGKTAGILLCLGTAALGAEADRYIAHEWGTFTTLTTSEGARLSGLYVDASPLPAFVPELPCFARGTDGEWPSQDKIRNVTVKMETPVLYFYAGKERDVRVKVDFVGGSINQWYPQRDGGEANPAGAHVDFKNPYTGSVVWNARVLGPGATDAISSPAAQETPEWRAPRLAAANLLRGSKGEVEKFLFYRGIGNFPLPVEAKFSGAGQLTLTNKGPHAIAYAMVYEKPWDKVDYNAPSVWWSGPLPAGTPITVSRAKAAANYQITAEFTTALEKAGLYNLEARALLNTWYDSYFTGEGGLKVFWIVPREVTDAIIPITIDPKPDSLVRVLVGRGDILTPEYQETLWTAHHNGGAAYAPKDKYRMAFQDYLVRRGKGEFGPPPMDISGKYGNERNMSPHLLVSPRNGMVLNPGDGTIIRLDGKILSSLLIGATPSP